MKNIFVITIVALFFTGFISVSGASGKIPEPSTEKNTLLAGKFLVNVNSTGKMSGANRDYTANIRIDIKDVQTDKVLFFYTQNGGWFITNDLSGGNYVIENLFIEYKEGRSTYRITLNGPYNLALVEGNVNNIGEIQIDVGNSRYSHSPSDFAALKNDFKNQFSDSRWNSYTWNDIPFR